MNEMNCRQEVVHKHTYKYTYISTVWLVVLGGPKERCIRWGQGLPTKRDNFGDYPRLRFLCDVWKDLILMLNTVHCYIR